MNDITLNLIVLVVFIVIGTGIFLVVRRKQATVEQEIRQMAEGNGWTFEKIREPLRWGLRLKSAHWTFESLSVSSGQESDSGSSNIAMSTTWQADSPGSIMLVGGRTSQVDLGGLGDMLARKVLQAAFGPEAGSLSQVQVGSAAFQQKFMVWAQDPVEAERLLTPAVQSMLMGWKGTLPLIKRTSARLTIELQGTYLKKVEEIQALINLGNVLLASYLI